MVSNETQQCSLIGRVLFSLTLTNHGNLFSTTLSRSPSAQKNISKNDSLFLIRKLFGVPEYSASSLLGKK